MAGEAVAGAVGALGWEVASFALGSVDLRLIAFGSVAFSASEPLAIGSIT